MSQFIDLIQDYFYHGKNSDGQVEAMHHTARSRALAKELTEELTELQAERDPIAALVRRVRKNTRE